MLMKAPSAEEVLALVNAATGPDGNLDPAMHQLLLQLQEQHVLNQAQAQSGAHAGTGPTLNSGPSDSGLVSAAEVAGPEDVGPATTAMKRKSIPLSMKKEAIQWIMGPGRGVPSRAEKHFGALNWDVSASSFRKWWKNRDKILGDSASKKRISGGGRKPFLEDSEEKLLVVVIQERAKKDRVTRKWIAKTARHMFHRSDSTFKASENWVTKFIRRNGLTLKRSYVTSDPPAKLEQRRQQILASGAATEPGNKYVADNVKVEFVDL